MIHRSANKDPNIYTFTAMKTLNKNFNFGKSKKLKYGIEKGITGIFII